MSKVAPLSPSWDRSVSEYLPSGGTMPRVHLCFLSMTSYFPLRLISCTSGSVGASLGKAELALSPPPLPSSQSVQDAVHSNTHHSQYCLRWLGSPGSIWSEITPEYFTVLVTDQINQSMNDSLPGSMGWAFCIPLWCEIVG